MRVQYGKEIHYGIFKVIFYTDRSVATFVIRGSLFP